MRNKTKIISTIIGATLLLNATAPVMALGLSNSITPRSAIEINDCADLQSITDGNDYYLGGDITDCSGTFTTIRTFNNTLDGKGYTIEGLEGRNLFNRTGEDAIIKNITFENVVLSDARAALVEYHYGEIRNISVSGTITGYDEVGSIAAQTRDTAKIINSYSTAVVNLKDDKYNAGGLVGLMMDNSLVSNSYFAGEIDSKGEYGTGGIAGETLNNAKIENSYVDAPNITAPTKMGAIVGVHTSSEPLDNVFYSYRTTQGSSTEATEVTAPELQTETFYADTLGFSCGEAGWDLTNLPNPKLAFENRGESCPPTPEDPSNPRDGTINRDDVVYGQGQLVSTTNIMIPMLATAAAGLALNNKKRK